jgi:carboxypeptidase C (cathepsin A)
MSGDAHETDTKDAKDAKDTKQPEEPIDDLVTASHTLGDLAYTTTAGRIVLRAEKITDDTFDGNEARAEVFLTAYTLDGADPLRRPLTFAFNGGPGSSSVWLHLGLLGPRRVAMGDAGALLPPPYGLADNPQTLLAASDLVFIDPITTGYSRAVKGGKPKDFHGFTGDLESVGEVIRLWTSRHGRWLSPKYLCGESYGTVRAAALARHLQERHGMAFNGLMLISTVLDGGTLEFSGHNDVPYPLFLPTYAAIAHYHGLHGDRPLRELLAEAEAFATDGYARALARGARLTAAERHEAVTTVARLTGLSADYIDRVNLRIEHVRFFTEVLRSRRRTVGRLDGRFLGWDADYASERYAADPSYEAIFGPYTGAFNHYVRAELGYANDLAYNTLSREVQPWSYKEFEAQHLFVADRLAAAMRANPHLRVYIASGYYDGATPYLATEHTVAHLEIPDELRDRIRIEYFEAGHMMYVHEPSRVEQSRQLREFVAYRQI